jgi:hypothetical protein
MHSRAIVVFAAAAMLLASVPAARAANFTDERDVGNNLHQTLLDREYARTHPTVIPGTPPALTNPRSPYGYAPPHHSKTKRIPSHGN